MTDQTSDLTRSEARYLRLVERADGRLTSWRTPARRKLLISLLWTGTALLTVSSVALVWTDVAFIAWAVSALLIVAVPWTMLRTTIDIKDSAPSRFLDEFETSTLLEARSRALKFGSAFLAVAGLVLVYWAQLRVGREGGVPFAIGGLLVTGFFVTSFIPAAAMARIADDET